MIITKARHLFPEEKGFSIDRPLGEDNLVVFVHFRTSVKMMLNNKIIDVTPGTCIFYSPNFYQKWTATEPLIHDWLHIEPSGVEENLKLYGLQFNKLYKLNHPEHITQLATNIEGECFKKERLCEYMCDLLLKELMISISRNSFPRSKNTLSRKKELETLRQKLFSDISHNWTIPEMAKMLSLSPSRFYSIYKDEFGVSPTNDIIDARIHTAKIYLSTGDYSVGQVAEMLGYSNIYHFIRQFTKIVGLSPGRFSKNN